MKNIMEEEEEGGCYPKLPVLCVSAPGHRAVKDSREQEHQVSGREG